MYTVHVPKRLAPCALAQLRNSSCASFHVTTSQPPVIAYRLKIIEPSGKDAAHLAPISPRPTLSQNLLSLQTLPTPNLSSPCLRSSTTSRHRLSHTLPTHRRSPSLTLSRSMARVLANRAGATRSRSRGRTPRAMSASGGGREARRRDRRMAVSERASLRETTVVLVRKTRRWISSASDGREGDVRSGGSTRAA